ncbi:MAG: very short patch repair endonuclease [Elusimicrobiota bacterium]
MARIGWAKPCAPLMDTLTKAERSRIMSLVKAKNTKPEIIVRRIVSAMGLRYRLHSGKLPGRPDLVFSRARRVIFVHGCFWHRHIGCARCRMPKSRRHFWKPKLLRNRLRDEANRKELRKLKWSTQVIWECETDNIPALEKKLARILPTRK